MMGSGIDKVVCEVIVYEVLVDGVLVIDVCVCLEGVIYDVFFVNCELFGVEIELISIDNCECWLKVVFECVVDDYDFVLIDCLLMLLLLMLNGLCVVYGVVILMQCEYFVLEGLLDFVNMIKQVYVNMNCDLKIIGLLCVMFDLCIMLQQ